MDESVPKKNGQLADSSKSDTQELVEMLLEMSDEEIELLEPLYSATAHVRSSAATGEEKRAAVDRVLDNDPQLRETFRALTGRERMSLD